MKLFVRSSTVRPLGLAIAMLCNLAPAGASATSQAEAHAFADARCGGSGGSNREDTLGPQFALAVAAAAGGSSDPLVCNPLDPGFGVSTTAGAVATASLRSGQLSAYGTASGGPAPTAGSITLAQGTGDARIWDTVTVVGPFQPFSFDARVTLHVEGTITGFGGVNAAIFIGGAQNEHCLTTYAQTFCSGVVSPTGQFSFDLILDVNVTSSSPTFQLFSELNASAENDGVADASSTGTLSIQLPPGFTFTSGSGVLLVPEPSTLALAALGLSGLALVRRRPGAAHSSRSKRTSIAAS